MSLLTWLDSIVMTIKMLIRIIIIIIIITNLVVSLIFTVPSKLHLTMGYNSKHPMISISQKSDRQISRSCISPEWTVATDTYKTLLVRTCPVTRRFVTHADAPARVYYIHVSSGLSCCLKILSKTLNTRRSDY